MTTKAFVLALTVALAAALALSAAPARSLGGPGTCPAGFALVAPPEPDAAARLADRNADGRLCAQTRARTAPTASASRRPLAFRPNPRDCPGCALATAGRTLVLLDNGARKAAS